MLTECMFEAVKGRCLYTAGFDGLVKVWSCTDFSLQKSLPAHDGKVMGIDVFIPDDSNRICKQETGESHAAANSNSSSSSNSSNSSNCSSKGERGVEEAESIDNNIGGGEVIASAGFDRTWKLWHCSGVYRQRETRELLLQKYSEGAVKAAEDN